MAGWMRRIAGLLALILVTGLAGGLPVAGQSLLPTPTPTPDATPSPPTATATNTPRPTRPGPATATPTVTPEVPDFVYNWSTEIIFPQTVHFQIVVNYPLEQIAELTLTINAPGQPPRTLTRDQLLAEGLFIADTFTELRFPLAALRGGQVWFPLLAEVELEWAVGITDGQRAVIPDAFVFNDAESPWVLEEDPDGVLDLLYAPDDVSPLPLRNGLRQVIVALAEHTGAQTAPAFSLVLYATGGVFDTCASDDEGEPIALGPRTGVTVPCDPPLPRQVASAGGYTPLAVDAREGIGLQHTLMTYVIEQFYGPLWADRDVPEWFRVGLQTLVTPTDHSGLLELVRSAARINRVYRLDDAPGFDAPDRPLWEAQAYAMVLYTARFAELDAVYELAREGGDGESFAESFERITGRSLGALLPGWRNWIYSGVAERDAQLALYNGPTAVPSPTATVTPFPPSPTATATNTPTITPTPTVTGFLTATPLPTLTPTVSPTARPPTLTPRPASMAIIDTPTPAPTGFSLDDVELDAQTAATLVIALTVILVAALVAVYVRLGRRR